MRHHFRAPWGSKLRLTTGLFLAICAVVYFTVESPGSYIVLALVLLCSMLAVRGYSIWQGQLLIHRLGWATKFDLSALQRAEFNPGATIGSVRTMGIGGLFGFVGYFHNPILGAFRAYATNTENSVVLNFAGQTIVVTPERPMDFLKVIETESSTTR